MGLFKPNVEKLKNANDLAGLIQCLDHKNADVRFSAFTALVSRPNPDYALLTKLKNMQNDPSPKVRTIATLQFAGKDKKLVSENLKEIINKGTQREKLDLLHIIAGRGLSADETIKQVIAIALHDKNKLVKIEAIITAGATGNKHFIQNLTACLYDNLHIVRIQAAKAIYKIGGPDSIDLLIGLLVDRDKAVKEMAHLYLMSLDSERARKALNDHFFQLLVRGMNDVESVRLETAIRIGKEKVREGLPLLHGALQDEYKEVRVAALKAIAVFKDPSSVDFLTKMLEDRFHDARLEAVKTLGQIISVDSLKALEHALETGDRNMREEARVLIYRMKPRIAEITSSKKTRKKK